MYDSYFWQNKKYKISAMHFQILRKYYPNLHLKIQTNPHSTFSKSFDMLGYTNIARQPQ